MRKGLVVVALLALAAPLLVARPARAQPDQLQAGPWYGWQLMLADAAAVTVLFVPVSTEAGPVTRGMGMTAFLMNGPVVHMAHRNPRSASVSLMRLPLLLLGRLVGATAGSLLCKETAECVDTARLLGGGIGVMPVLLFDWWNAERPPRSYYATGDPPRLPPRQPPRPIDGWVPTVPLVAGRF